ncbi:MAG TPA: lysoplasmalogenase [Arenibacter sp.]|nr:lysoplasmalogenase [Arenibacter sp.]
MDFKNGRRSIPFLTFFIPIVLLDLIFGSIGFDGLRLLSKPLILISLIFYFSFNGKHLPKNIFKYTFLALCFSLLGDIMLLFDYLSSFYFIFGLIAFLLAHIGYTLVFFRQGNKDVPKEFWWMLAVLIIYGLSLYFILMDHLGGLKVPVIIYISAILIMAITAYNRKKRIERSSYLFVLIGALFFIISDSVLASTNLSSRFPDPTYW